MSRTTNALAPVLAGFDAYRAAVIYAPTPLIIVRNDGSIFDASTAFCDLLGYTRKDLQDSNFLDYVHPDDHARTLTTFAALTLTGARMNEPYKNRYIHRNGDSVHLSWHVGANAVSGDYRIAYCAETPQ